jgi:L-lactate dehydrogenase
MYVSIIGGGGLVGSSAAFALQCGGVVSEMSLIDLGDKVKGEALDILHGSSLVADQRIQAAGYEAIPKSDIILITAGLRRKPDESRLDLINRNTELFLNILNQIHAAGTKPGVVLVVVSNPVDILTYFAQKRLNLPAGQVIGLGTMLDSARFRSLIAADLNLPPTQVTATIYGEHGESMVPAWSVAQAAGLPLDKFPGWSNQKAEELFKRTRGSGAEVIKLKGGAGFAVGISIREVIHAVAQDSRRILPVATVLNGAYGISDVALSVPSIVGAGGVRGTVEIALTPKELTALKQSGDVLKATIGDVLKTFPDARKPISGGASIAARPVAASSGSAASKVTQSGASGGNKPRVTISGGGYNSGR